MFLQINRSNFKIETKHDKYRLYCLISDFHTRLEFHNKNNVKYLFPMPVSPTQRILKQNPAPVALFTTWSGSESKPTWPLGVASLSGPWYRSTSISAMPAFFCAIWTLLSVILLFGSNKGLCNNFYKIRMEHINWLQINFLVNIPIRIN